MRPPRSVRRQKLKVRDFGYESLDRDVAVASQTMSAIICSDHLQYAIPSAGGR